MGGAAEDAWGGRAAPEEMPRVFCLTAMCMATMMKLMMGRLNEVFLSGLFSAFLSSFRYAFCSTYSKLAAITPPC